MRSISGWTVARRRTFNLGATLAAAVSMGGCPDAQDGDLSGEAGSSRERREPKSAPVPDRVVTRLGQPSIEVYASTTVTCTVEDPYGKWIDLPTEIDVPAAVEHHAGTVTSSVVGTHTLTCRAPDLPGLTEVPALLEVVPGPPAAVELAAKPDLVAYDVGDVVTLVWVVTDVHGNPVPDDLPGVLSLPTQGVAPAGQPEEHKIRFLTEGIFTVGVTLDPPYELLADTLELTVDQTGPVITIKWPHRGATLEGDGAPLEVVGTVEDAFAEVDTLWLAGEEVAVQPGGGFVAAVIPRWGVNPLVFEAEDSFGNASKVSPSFQYASDYVNYAEEDAQGVVHPEGVALLAGQPFLDDGVHDPADLDDLATLMEVLLGEIDLAALTGGATAPAVSLPVLAQDGFDVGVVEVHWWGDLTVGVELAPTTDLGPTSVVLDSRVGGIDSLVVLGEGPEEALTLDATVHLALPVHFAWSSPWGLFPPGEIVVTPQADVLTGLSADLLSLKTKIDIAKAPGGDLQVATKDLDVGLEGLELDPIQDVLFELEAVLPDGSTWSQSFQLSSLIDLNALSDLLLDGITKSLLPTLLDAAEPLVETFAGDAVEMLLSLVEISQILPLPAMLGLETEELTLASNLSSVQFSESGGIVGLGMGFWAEKGVERDPAGAIARGGCLGKLPGELAYGWDHSLGLAIQTDVLNGLLFAIWWSGYLHGPLDLSTLASSGLPIPIEGLGVELDPLLAPIVNDCSDDGSIALELGDFHAKLGGTLFEVPLAVDLFVDLSLQISFVEAPDGLYVEVGELAFFDVEVAAINQEILEVIDLRELLEHQLGTLVAGALQGQKLGPLVLPAADLGTLVPGLPAGASLQLASPAIGTDAGYLLVETDLE